MMVRGSVTSAALPPHELKNLPNYAHLYNLPAHEVPEAEDEATVISDLKNRTKKDKKSRWSNQPARKVEVVALDDENWDDVDIAEAEVPEEITKAPKANDEDNWDDEVAPEDLKKEAKDNKSSDQDETEDNKKSSSETSEQKDSWDEDAKSPASNEKSQDSTNQGPKKIDADFLGQHIAVQIEKIRHRQAILVQQHINTQVIQSGRIISCKSPPIIIEKLGATIVEDIYDVSMPPPLIISADAIISTDVSPIESVILAQAIQITNKKRGFESIALAPVVHHKLPVVAAPPTEIIDLVDTSEVIVNSREGIEVSRPTYGLLRKTIPVKPIKKKTNVEENWDDDDEDTKPPKKVDLNALSSAMKVDDLLQVVSDEENWEDDPYEEVKEKPKSKKYEESSRKKSRCTKKGSDNDNWDDEESNQDYHQVDPDILARHMAEFAAGTTKNKKSAVKSSSAIADEDENWDDDPELDEASKKLIDPEILAKNVQLHSSLDSEASGYKIEPLENTCESFRKEFSSTKHREKSKVIKALSTMPTSVASLPVSAAIAAYTAQKRKLSEQAYEYQPRREWADPRKHPDPYSYPTADYVVPVDYGRVPQPHPTHYAMQYDYYNYQKLLYLAPEKSAPVTSKPKVKQLKGELSVNKKKTVVEDEKKKKMDLNAEDLSDGEIVDSEEDFGSDINSGNEDDDVIEIPVKVDLVDLTEEEMAAAVKEESETVHIKKENVFNPPMPTEVVEIPKPPEIEDSPESPVNMEVNEYPEEWQEEQKTQEDSPASPENMDVTRDQQESPASPVNTNETEVTTDVPGIEESKESQLDYECKAPESVIASNNNQIEESPASPSNETIEDSPASPANKETETSEEVNEALDDNEPNSSSVHIPIKDNLVIKEVTEAIVADKLPAPSVNENIESHEEMNTETSPDCPVKEVSEEIPAESSPSSPVKEYSEESPSSPAESDIPNNEAQPEESISEEITSLIKDTVEVNDETLPEQLKITSDLTEVSLELKEHVTISSTETPADENSSQNHEKPETPKKDTQETEEPSKLVEVPTESDSEMDDDDILLDDDELEAAALFLSNEEKEKVSEVQATTSSNEIQEASVEIPVTSNGSSIKDDVRFNPYILIKKGICPLIQFNQHKIYLIFIIIPQKKSLIFPECWSRFLVQLTQILILKKFQSQKLLNQIDEVADLDNP